MTFPGTQAFFALGCTVTGASLLAACSLLPEPHGNPVQDSRVPEGLPLRKVVQLGFGREAVFSACIDPACPTLTRKTLVTTQPVATALQAMAVLPIIEQPPLPASAAKPPKQRALADSNGDAPQPALMLHFPLAATGLTASDKAALDELVPDARKAARIVITSRTDNVGSVSANQAAALARANSVRDYLRSKLSAPDEALVIDARGSCCFITSNDTPEGRRQNRRVEIVLSVSEQVTP